LTLLPTLLVFTLAILLKRPIEALVAGSVAGLLMLAPGEFMQQFAERSVRVMTDEDVAWVILVCGFMGSLIGLLVRSGGTAAFTARVTGVVRSQRSALLCTWGLGLTMFVDDYLNSLAVGSAMRSVTDRYRTSREMLAYVVDSTAAPVSVIIPISTWAVFFGGLLESNGLAADGEGVATYIRAIPYMFYAWIAVAVVPLVIWGRIPLLGAMRRAERRAQETGQCVPPGAEHVEMTNQSVAEKPGVDRKAANFAVPMVALVFFTWYFDIDFLKGIYLTLALTVSMLLVRRTLTLHETFDTVIDGFKTMIEPLGVLVAAFLFKDVNDALGLTPYVIEQVRPYMTAELLPMLVFLTMGLVSFATGSNWGVFVIVLPIVTTLAREVGADMTLVVGATLSASTFGSHACFYSDATVLTAQASGCTAIQHAVTQLPYAVIAAAVAALGYYIVA
jgi:Na+/H+ antiporter NhaC